MTESPRVFFVVGFSRSGTTLMSALLDGHPSLAVTPETSLLLPFNRARVKAACTGDTDALSALLEGWAIGPEAVMDRLGFQVEGARSRVSRSALMSAILEAYAERFGVGHIGEKTPMHAWYLSTLWRWFPEAKVVAMVRDGRDAVPSLLKLPGKGGDPRPLALWWAKTVEGLWSLSRRDPGRVRLVRFEDLVSDPESVVNGVVEFLGVEASPTGLVEAGRMTELVLEREVWKQKVREPVDASRAEAWRREPDRSGMRGSDALMSRALHRLGYPDPPVCGLWERWCGVLSAQCLRFRRGLRWHFKRVLGSRFDLLGGRARA